MHRAGKAALAALLVTLCRSDEATPCGTVLEQNFDTSFFAADLGRVGLLDALNRANQNLTILAPSDAAFAQLPSGHKGMLRTPVLELVLDHHIHNGTKLWGAALLDIARRGAELTMRSGSKLAVSTATVNGTDLQFGNPNRTVDVWIRDVPCAGGVIHVLDGVLPDTPGAPLPSQDLKQLVMSLPAQSFKNVQTATHFLDLLRGDGPVTVLLPSDAPAVADSSLVTRTLSRHVLRGYYSATDMQRKGSARTYDVGKSLSWTAGGVIETGAPPSSTTPRVCNRTSGCSFFARNGVMHYISGLVLPPGAELDDIPMTSAKPPVLRMFSHALQGSGASSALRSRGPFTVFAPSTAAWNAISFGLQGWLRSDAHLYRQVLLQHVHYGRSAELEALAETRQANSYATMLSRDSPLYVHKEGSGAKLEYLVTTRRIIGAGQAEDLSLQPRIDPNASFRASNGIIHVINAVIFPRELEDELPTQKVAEYLESRDDLSTFKGLAYKVRSRGQARIQSLGPITVIAFTNAAFEGLTDDERDNLADPELELETKVASFHIIRTYISLADFRREGQSGIETVDEKAQGGFWAVYAGWPDGARTALSARPDGADNAYITESNIVCTNGVVHVIDKVLWPPDVDKSVHSGWGWEKCEVRGGGHDVTGSSRCTHLYQCYAHHTADALKDHDSSSSSLGSAPDVAFVAFVMLVGAFVRHKHNSVLSVLPYELTIFLLVAGFGGLASLGKPLSDYDGLSGLAPNIIFYVFLPPLMFHAAFTCDTYHVKRIWYTVLMTSVLGVVLTALLIMMMAKQFYQSYKWKMYTCLVYGMMFAAPDPVSVVGNVKGLVASGLSTTFLIGESLIGSGLTIAIVDLMVDTIPTGTFDDGFLIFVLHLAKKLVGGPVVGVIVGLLLTRCMKEVFNDPIVEITSTFIAAYVAFYLSESVFTASGTLAVVTCGSILSYKETCISPEVIGTMRSFWAILVFCTTTLIFAIAGLQCAKNAFGNLALDDVLYVLGGYLGMNFIRAFVLTIVSFLPPKSRKFRLRRATLLFFSWNGLRGGVVLLLALIIKGDDSIHCYDKYLGDRFLFHATGIVILTLCVNRTLAPFLVDWLGLNEVTVSTKRNMRTCFADLKSAMEDELLMLKLDPLLSEANWNKVKQVSFGELDDPYTKSNEKLTLASQAELLEQARAAYFALFDNANFSQFRDGLLLGSAQRVLHKWRCDTIELEGATRERMRPLISSDRLQKLWTIPPWKQRLCRCRVERMQVRRFGFSFNVLLGFINAHDHITENIDKLVSDTLASSRVKEHCRRVRSEATAMMTEATADHADVSIAMRTKAAARHVLNAGRMEIQRQLRGTEIDARDALVLRRLVERQMKKVPKLPRSLARSGNDETLTEWVHWYGVDPNCKYQLSRIFRYHVFERDSRIFKKHSEEERRGFYVVLKGMVRVHHRGSAQTCGQGYAIGLLSSLTDTPGHFTDVWAESFLHVARFPAAEVRHCARIYPLMKEAIWLQAGRTAALHCMSVHSPWLSWERRALERLLRGSSITEILRSRPMSLQHGSFYVLFNGRCSSAADPKDYVDAVALIPERLFGGVIFDEKALVLSVPDSGSAQAKARRRWQKIHERLRVMRALTWLQGFAGYRRELARTFGGGDDSPKALSQYGGRSPSQFGGVRLQSRPSGSQFGPAHSSVYTSPGRASQQAPTELAVPLIDRSPQARTGSPQRPLSLYAPPSDAPQELRRDPNHGGLYTKSEFREFYNGLDEWEAAAHQRGRSASGDVPNELGTAAGNGTGARDAIPVVRSLSLGSSVASSASSNRARALPGVRTVRTLTDSARVGAPHRAAGRAKNVLSPQGAPAGTHGAPRLVV
eukprot:TRINITY_DN44931_c0_g1_i1.p1 TRINITY_DN44931_c0_g1~~TRINITY_DN44931_c0_g1_i1.p1  ORF type:complete len:1853 (+),score=420.57 TRINITY_DN44931_c0_g1_i1:72-5630(+)